VKGSTRERVPLKLAATQNNLTPHFRTGETATGRLKDPVAAYREALTEYTRERMPLDCARIRNNLGTALQRLGERQSGTQRLEEAREAIGLAWRVYQEAGMGQYDAWFKTRLTAIDDLIASRG
jgi:hypothetical protein